MSKAAQHLMDCSVGLMKESNAMLMKLIEWSVGAVSAAFMRKTRLLSLHVA